MTTENLEIIQTNLINLFGIMNSDSGIKFVQTLEKVTNYAKGSISELIKSCNDTEVITLIKVAMKAKFKEQPKPYFDAIVSVLKSETK